MPAGPRVEADIGRARVHPPDARQSHRFLDSDIDPGDVDEKLRLRWSDALEQGKLHDLQSLFGDKDRLKRLTKDKLTPNQLKFLDANSDKISALLRDPQLSGVAERDQVGSKIDRRLLTDGQIEALKKLADNNLDPASLPAEGESTGSPSARGMGNKVNPSPFAEPGGNEQNPSSSGTSSDSGETWWERQLNKLSSSVMDRVNDPANGDAFESALK